MRSVLAAVTICLAAVGCGFPPIINGARFLVLSESGTDAAQLDFTDQDSCMAAKRADTSDAARCQRTTLWNVLLVETEADLPDGTRVGAHFRSLAQCEHPQSLSRIGAAVFGRCVARR